jgi:hypothetical protein
MPLDAMLGRPGAVRDLPEVGTGVLHHRDAQVPERTATGERLTGAPWSSAWRRAAMKLWRKTS